MYVNMGRYLHGSSIDFGVFWLAGRDQYQKTVSSNESQCKILMLTRRGAADFLHCQNANRWQEETIFSVGVGHAFNAQGATRSTIARRCLQGGPIVWSVSQYFAMDVAKNDAKESLTHTR